MRDSGGSPYGAKSDFEGESHTRLRAMVESSDPHFVMEVGVRLSKAHQVMEELGSDLMSRMNGLEWTGAAADAFKAWGVQVSKATLELSEYSRVTGDFMTNAGETLSTVKKAMPEVPEKDIAIVAKHRDQPSAKVGGGIAGGILAGPLGALAGSAVADKAMKTVNPGWVTDAEAKAAQTRVDAAHQQAIAQMEKLGQSYEMSTDVMKSATVPTFPPTPQTLMPPRSSIKDGTTDVNVGSPGSGRTSGRVTGGGTTVKGTSGVGSTSATSTGGGHVGGSLTSTNPTIGTGHLGGSQTSTGIDGAVVAPTPPGYTAVLPGTGAGPTGAGGSVPPLGVFPGTSGGTVPGGSRPGAVKSRAGYAGGVVGDGESGLKGGTTGRRSGYGGTTVGAEEGAHATGSGRSGSGGGRGSSAGRGSANGAAVGDMEEGHGGHGSSGGAGRGSRGGAGRRLAAEEGGMVGGRRGPGARGEFTPGGSGLRNRGGGAVTGPDGNGEPAGSAGGRNSRDRRAHRPDYLVEDEDTWTSGAADSNPTVIE